MSFVIYQIDKTKILVAFSAVKAVRKQVFSICLMEVKTPLWNVG